MEIVGWSMSERLKSVLCVDRRADSTPIDALTR